MLEQRLLMAVNGVLGGSSGAGSDSSATAETSVQAAPTITTFQVNDGSAQRSMVDSLTLVFSQQVALASNAITLTQNAVSGSTPVSMPFSLNSPDGGTTWVLTFTNSSYIGGSLPDGLYSLTVSAAGVTNSSGQNLSGGNQAFAFSRMYGDFTGQGMVNASDYSLLTQNFRQVVGGTSLWYLDYTGSGLVNAEDFYQLSSREGLFVHPTLGSPNSLSASNSSTGIALAWSAVSGASSYDIYRGTITGGESKTPLATRVAGTSFTDTSVSPGNTYYYTVSAVSGSDQSPPSLEASATAPPATLLAPGNIIATATSSQSVTVDWSDVSGEDGFEVYQSTGDNFSLVATVGAGVTTYTANTLSSDTTYTYEIVAIGPNGASSAPSALAAATTANVSAGIYGLTATAQPGEILLAWPAVTNAASYSVYRGAYSGGESSTPIQSGIGNITNFADPNVAVGSVYYYYVEAFLKNGSTLTSSEVSATPLAPPPAAPASLTAVGITTGIQLTWSAVPGATSYDIFRGLATGQEAPTAYQTDVTDTTFTDTAVSGLGTYYYLVEAVNGAGPGAGSPEASASSPSVQGMPAPVDLSANVTSTSNITVSWQDVPGETGFELLRSTDGVNFAQVTTLSAGTTNYADSGLNPGTTYYYELITLGPGGASPASASVSAMTQAEFVGSDEPAPETTDGWTSSDPSNLVTPTTQQPNNIFYVGMPVVYNMGTTAVSYQVRDYYGNLVDQGNGGTNVTLNVSQPGWYKLYVYGSSASAQFGNIIGTSTFVIFNNDPSDVQVTDLAQGNYYFIDPAMTRVDPTINFNWSNSPPSSNMPMDYYGVEWTGEVQAQYTQTYTFSTVSDDGARLWVNGQELINDWTPHAATTDSATIALVAGQLYSIKLEYYQNLYNAVISLSWSSPSTPQEIIPASALFPTATSTTSGGLTGQYFIGLTSSDPSENTVIHDIADMGPERINVTQTTDVAEAIADVQADIDTDEALYSGADPMRPSDLLISFTNGTSNISGVEQIVAAFQNQVQYWEGQNEPDTGAYSGAGYVPVEQAFYDAVKSVNPNLDVLGPAVVSINDTSAGLPWIQQFLAAGGGNYIDGFSFHAYDTNEGSLYLLRESLSSLESLLDQYGLGNIPIWQTEQGYPTALYGSYQPQLQGQWLMLQMMVYEQFGIPKEHNVVWYDASHGYWDIPDWWQNDDGTLLPTVPLMNEWSQELQGTTFTGAYNFGSENNLYIGSLFTGPGKAVAAFMSAGEANGSITLNVQGGSSLVTYSAFGAEQVIPVVNGQATLTVPEEPVYVNLAPGQSITVAQANWGQDLAEQSGAAASSNDAGADNQNIGQIISGVQNYWYWNGNGEWGDLDYTSNNDWVQITLPQQETINNVVIIAMPPWQLAGTLMQFQLQYYNQSTGQWVTLENVAQQADTFGVFTPVDDTTVDSYFDNQYIFQEGFSPVTTSEIRLVVQSASYGGGATQLVDEAGGQASPTQTLTLNQIEIFGPQS